MMNGKNLVTIVVYALIGWALCFATMGIGQALLPLQTALIIHAIAAPIFFALLSVSYFKRFNYTTPMQTALLFVGIVIGLDFFVVALLILRSTEMFTSLLGTWIPFALIFASTYVTGLYITRNPQCKAAAQ
jgi:hypothetical protein